MIDIASGLFEMERADKKAQALVLACETREQADELIANAPKGYFRDSLRFLVAGRLFS